jgi:hypothetical protein
MTDSKTLDDAFNKRAESQKQLRETKETIAEAAKPLVLSALATYQENLWPGRTSEDITTKIHELYDKRFTEEDITTALEKLSRVRKIYEVHIGQRTGYKLNYAIMTTSSSQQASSQH